jgi:superfamily I DNA/RNA helicase
MKAAVKRAEDDHLTLGVLQERFGLQTTAVWHDALDRLPQDEVSYMLAARRSGEKLTAAPRVRLSTIHGSKGGEAEHVVLLAEMAKRTFVEMRDDEDSEARVFYVGATRARSRLTVVESQTERAYPYI